MNKFELYFIYCMNCLGIILLGGFMTYVYYLANERYIIVVIGISICLLISICLFFVNYPALKCEACNYTQPQLHSEKCLWHHCMLCMAD